MRAPLFCLSSGLRAHPEGRARRGAPGGSGAVVQPHALQLRAARGRVVQVDHIKPKLKQPGTKLLILKPSLRYDYPLIPLNRASRPIRDEER